MNSKLFLCPALVLCVWAVSCSTATKQEHAELTWPAVADGKWEWTPKIVNERFAHASKKILGSNEDVAESNQVIAFDDPH